MWFALCLAWLIVIVVTDIPAWTLVVWIAASIGSITALERKGKASR